MQVEALKACVNAWLGLLRNVRLIKRFVTAGSDCLCITLISLLPINVLQYLGNVNGRLFDFADQPTFARNCGIGIAEANRMSFLINASFVRDWLKW